MVQVHSHVGASEKGIGPPRTCQQGHPKVCAETLNKAKSALQIWETENAGLFRESVHLQDV